MSAYITFDHVASRPAPPFLLPFDFQTANIFPAAILTRGFTKQLRSG